MEVLSAARTVVALLPTELAFCSQTVAEAFRPLVSPCELYKKQSSQPVTKTGQMEEIATLQDAMQELLVRALQFFLA